ncbi:MAG: stage III sporulation protein AF [Clostridiales bacterium]|nr:stage III sporulation protein AF [Clostridiales bacterium]
MSEIYEWVRKIVIYLILNTIIMNLLGNSSYKKYVSLVSGMILLLIVLSPFLKLLKIDSILDYYLNANIYKTEANDFERELRLMEEKQRETVFTDYKDKIRRQVEELILEEGLFIYEFDLVMNLDEESESFGEISAMNINAGYEENLGVPVHKISIDKIIISTKSKESIPNPEEIHIKNKLSDFYNMKQDNINISIQGG